MNNLAKIFILLIVVLSSSVFFAQTTNNMIKSRVDTLTINVSNDSLALDTTTQNTLVSTSIDSIGTLQDAIKDAAKTAGIEDEEPYIIKKPEEKEKLINLLLSSVSDGIKPKSIMPYYEEIMSAKYIGIPMYIYIPNYIGEN